MLCYFRHVRVAIAAGASEIPAFKDIGIDSPRVLTNIDTRSSSSCFLSNANLSL